MSTKTGLNAALVTLGCSTVLALFAAGVGNTQGISGSATVVSKSGSDIEKLKQQIQALEKRVAELEKGEAQDVKDDAAEEIAAQKLEHRLTDGENGAKKLEQRLASLEKKRENRTDDKSGDVDSSDDASPLTVTAPFTVVDGDGKTLMRVGEEANGFSRGIYVYNSSGSSVAHMGSLPDGGGRLYVARPNTVPAAFMAAPTAGGLFQAGDNGGFVAIDKQSLKYYFGTSTPVAVFGTKDRSKGYLELSDSTGSKMVEAGSLASRKGYVLTSPYATSVTPEGNPSVLMGKGK